MKKIFALLICVLFSYNTVWAQAPTIDDMHKALEYAARETNRQLSIKKISVDEVTIPRQSRGLSKCEPLKAAVILGSDAVQF